MSDPTAQADDIPRNHQPSENTDSLSLHSSDAAEIQDPFVPAPQTESPASDFAHLVDAYRAGQPIDRVPRVPRPKIDRSSPPTSPPKILNFSVKWNEDIRSFHLDVQQIETMSYDTLINLFEMDRDRSLTSWPLRPKDRRRPAMGLFARLSRKNAKNHSYALFIEHRRTDGRPTSRPRSIWSVLSPWQQQDRSLQIQLLRDFFRAQAMERKWVMILVHDSSDESPDDDIGWSPSGLERLGKGLSRLSWGLGNLLGTTNNEQSFPSDVSRAEDHLRIAEASRSQSTRPPSSVGSIYSDSQPIATTSATPHPDRTKDRRTTLFARLRKDGTASRRYGTNVGDADESVAILTADEIQAAETPRPSQASQRPRSWNLFPQEANPAVGKQKERGQSGQVGERASKQRGRRLLRFFIPAIFRQPKEKPSSLDSDFVRDQDHIRERDWLDPQSVDVQHQSQDTTGAEELDKDKDKDKQKRKRSERRQLFERVDLPEATQSPAHPKYGQVPAIPGRLVSLSKTSQTHRQWSHNSSLSMETHREEVLRALRASASDPATVNTASQATRKAGPSKQPPAASADKENVSPKVFRQSHPHGVTRHTADQIDTDTVPLGASQEAGSSWSFKLRKKRASRRRASAANGGEAMGSSPKPLHPSASCPEQLGRGAFIVNRPDDARAEMRKAWLE